jgi:hypothetical protein
MVVLLALLVLLTSAPASQAQQREFVKIAPEPKSHAWWLRAEFHPLGTDIRGIPLARIDRTWCRATEFRNDLFPPEARSDLKQTIGLAFSVDGSFDGSKTRQTALIGVYESCAGQKGSFLLVLANPPDKPASVRYVHAMPDAPFGMLAALPDATIQVFHCLECDNSTKFKWSKRQRRFVQLPPGKEDD